MDSSNMRTGITLGVGIILGIILGIIYAYLIAPVEFVDAGPQDLIQSDQEAYIRNLADVYSFDPGNQQRVIDSLDIWPEAHLTICQMARDVTPTDPGYADRLRAIARIHTDNNATLPNGGCDQFAPDQEIPTELDIAQDSGGLSPWLIICFLGLLVIIIGVAIYVVMNRSGGSTGNRTTTYDSFNELPAAAPVMQADADEGETTPVARFRTTYARGHDTYDDSFSIENANGDFLGECGVGISESIGTDSPKNVTALEVWLFDKNDIRTVTKVIMSNHAFFDDAIQAKLAPKGEPVLARQNETVVLETAALIVNADITEMTYGTDPSLPPESYLENFTVELSIWAKEGEESNNDSGIDDMLDF